MVLSTFETLPNEILMIILRYSGTVYTIFRTFSGLNQRLNNILVDRRLHLLADFLFISRGDPKFNYYYNSVLFNDISRQLSSLTTVENDKQLRQCLQSLMTFHIEESWKQLRDQYQSNRNLFQSIRANLNDDVIFNLDQKLSETFKCYDDFIISISKGKCRTPVYLSKDAHMESIKYIEQIESLVLTKGARLECDDYPSKNFACAVKEWLLSGIYTSRSSNRRLINPIIRMLKTLLISNPNLLENRSQVRYNTNWPAYFLLFVSIWQFGSENYWAIYDSLKREDDYTTRGYHKSPINIECYLAMVDLLLFSMQCKKDEFQKNNWLVDSFDDIFHAITSTKFFLDHKIFISTIQMAILKIVLDELYSQREIVEWNKYKTHWYGIGLERLVKKGRLDAFSMICHYSEKLRHLSPKLYDTGLLLRMLHGNRKPFFNVFWYHLSETQLKYIDLFILLKKKECKLVKKCFKKFPILIHRCDEDGNDPLLYVCLKVRGGRYRLVKFLIEMGCDFQRRNSKGENFTDVLRLQKSRQLMENLIEREIIHIDDASGEIKVMVANRFQ